ncbi:hypothetical protein LCGC14_1407870 [marine sediment metagenome]|uniref:Uncharacterized protein n=1 Tax=marine sediment metagenome TaxID=412755 RepID=A0A0F9JV42_9ZZZZ
MKRLLIILVDPYKVNMDDVIAFMKSTLHIKEDTKGAALIRYRTSEWGHDHPAIQLFTIDESTGISSIEELKEKIKLGEIEDEQSNTDGGV